MTVRPEPVLPTAFGAEVLSFRDLVEIEPKVHPSSTPGGRRLFLVRFDVIAVRVEVAFDDETSAATLASHYDARPDDAVPAVRLAVERVPAGVRFDGGSRAWIWPHGPLPPETIGMLADVAARVLAFASRDLLALHAAALAGPSGAVALSAPSGTGKSTTAAAAVDLGVGLFSDEHCVVDRDGRVHPLERSISLRRGGLEALASESGRRARYAGPVLVRPSAIPGGRFGWGLPELRHVVLLERDRGEAASGPAARVAELEPIEREATLAALLDGVMCRERGVDRLERIVRLVRRCKTWRLRAGAPGATARLLADLVGVTA